MPCEKPENAVCGKFKPCTTCEYWTNTNKTGEPLYMSASEPVISKAYVNAHACNDSWKERFAMWCGDREEIGHHEVWKHMQELKPSLCAEACRWLIEHGAGTNADWRGDNLCVTTGKSLVIEPCTCGAVEAIQDYAYIAEDHYRWLKMSPIEITREIKEHFAKYLKSGDYWAMS